MKPALYSLSPEQVRTLEQLAPRAIQWARLHGKRHRDVDQLDSVALTGAARAIQNYDPTRGMSLRSFVLYTVRNRVLRVMNPTRGKGRSLRTGNLDPESLPHLPDTRPDLRDLADVEQERVDRVRDAADRVRDALRNVHPLVSRVFEQRLAGTFQRDSKGASASLGVTQAQYRSAYNHLKQIINKVAHNA